MKKLNLLVLLMALATIGYAQTPYWSYSFDGGALTDGQGNDNLTASTNTFTTVTDRFSQANDAISLDGDSLIGGTNYSESIAVSFWIKDAPNDASNRALIQHFDGYGYSVRLQNGLITGVGRLGWRNMSGNPLQPYFSGTSSITSTTNVADGQWHHVVYVVYQTRPSGTRWQQDYSLYIDGNLEASDTKVIDIISGNSRVVATVSNAFNFRVGHHETGSLVRYENIIDDIDYFDSRLTSAQVQNIYNARIPQIVYVDKDATGGANDGSSWADAFTSLKDATDFATMAGDEIWVADGVYTPHPSDRSELFEISADVSLYGGFNGTETQLSQRDWRTNETILSGDLNGNDNNTLSFSEPTRSDNSYRVVFQNGDNSLIDGVTIEGGQGNNTGTFGEERGSAIYMSATGITLKNSTIKNNVSRIDGAVRAGFTGGSSNTVSIQSCRFENNLSRYGSGFTSNTTSGGVTDIQIINSEFYNNRAADLAGGAGFAGSSIAIFANSGNVSTEIVNNTFAYNKDYGTSSGQDKGTILLRRLNDFASVVLNAEVHNNIFYQNEVSAGNVTTKAIGLMNRPSNLIDVINFTNNNSGQNNFGSISSSGTVSGNVDLNPDFVDGSNGNFALLPSSPMIDIGDNSKLPASVTEDIAGNARIDNSIIDLGANENDPNACFPITQQPQDQTACTNGSVTLSVTASEAGASYQWNFNGTPISGETSASLTINNVQASDAGNYTVDVTVGCGSATSNIAVLTVSSGPTITQQPRDTVVCEGNNFFFTVNATGSGILTYEWQFDGDPAPLAGFNTSSSILLTANNFVAAGELRVLVSDNSGCTVVSDTVGLTLTPNFIAPTQEPQDETVCTGETAKFFVVVDPVPNQTYQWYKDGIAINGETDSVLTIANAQPIFDEGNYYVEIDNPCAVNAYPTGNAELTVVPAANTTSITGQPSSQTACPGDNISFTVTATGANLTYQWKKDGSNISGATSASLTLNNVSNADIADYTVDVAGDCGSETSNIASLSLNVPTVITAQPSNETACEDGSVTFSVTASGANLSYQWKKDGNNISGATSASYTLNNLQASDAADYTVEVSGDCGSETSNIATLTVTPLTDITVNFLGVDACEGDNVPFSVSGFVNGANLTYQWYYNGTAISGETSDSYTLSNAAISDAGDYSVIANGTCGADTISTTVTVTPSTVITAQPADETVCEGSNVTLSVTATGSNLTYQWTKDGSNINGATSASLSLSNIQISDAGDYEVIVSGDCGSETSNTATVTVNQGISITQQPTAQTVCEDTDVTFTVAATGSGLSYQWTKGGNAISGETAATLQLNGVTSSDAADYAVDITASCGTLTSNTATLTVNDSTEITTQPVNETLCEGGNVTLSVVATGSNLTYQWAKDGSNISGATSASLSLSNIQISDAGDYEVVVSGDCGSKTSNTATVTVNPGISVTQQPAAQTVCEDTDVTFSVTATGSGLSYQWTKDGSAISGATATTLQLNGVTSSDAGDYAVEITASCGTLTSNTAILTVNDSTEITTQPVNETLCEGGNVSLSVVASGSNLTYQWVKDGSNISGATSASLALTNAQLSDSGDYEVVVTGDCGVETSASATVTVNPGISVTQQPSSSVACLGDNVQLEVVATGTGLSYQWVKDNTPVSGATSTTLSLTNVQAVDAGDYYVEVSASCGTVNTDTANLTVGTPTSITQQPSGMIVCEGVDTVLSVVATGSNLTYQWNFNGNPISGATSDELNLNNIQTTDDGSYTVDVIGDCGTETSTNVAVTVNSNPDFFQQPGILNPLCLGDTVTLSSSVLGNTFGSQWLLNGDTIVGQTAADITIENITVADTGDYVREVTGECGVFYSNTVNLSTEPATSITTQPTDASVCAGDQAAFTVDAEGGNLSYEWFFNGNSIGTVVGNTNVVSAAAASSDEGFYYAVVTGECGITQSDSAELTVTTLSAQITESNGVLSTGTFDSYQWYQDGSAISGATSATYTPISSGDFTVEVTGNNCTVTSDVYSFTFVGIGNISSNAEINIFPNPFDNTVNIQWSNIGEVVNIQIIDVAGKVVFEKGINQGRQDAQLGLDRLASGSYFINIQDEDGYSSISKLIKR